MSTAIGPVRLPPRGRRQRSARPTGAASGHRRPRLAGPLPRRAHAASRSISVKRDHDAERGHRGRQPHAAASAWTKASLRRGRPAGGPGRGSLHVRSPLPSPGCRTRPRCWAALTPVPASASASSVRRDVLEERAERRDAECAADHAAHRQDPGGRRRPSRLDRVHRGGRHRRHRERRSRGPSARRRGGGGRSRCRRRCATAGRARRPRAISPATIGRRGPMRSVSRPAIGAISDDHQRRGQEAHAGLERRVAEDVLHVERHEEEHREHRERDDEGDHVRAEEGAASGTT